MSHQNLHILRISLFLLLVFFSSTTKSLGQYSLDSTFVFNGIDPNDQSGISVSSAGDFNGDGFADILISASAADPNGNLEAGETYLIFGTDTPLPFQFNLSSLNGTNGIQFNGIGSNDWSGTSVSSAGDFNGDGFDDILIGANNANPNGNSAAGETYLIFGTNIPLASQFNLSSINGTNGIQFNGIDAGDTSGISVSSAGDFNGDGFDDILIGAYGADPNAKSFAGETYLIFGTNIPLASQFNLSSINGTNGIQFTGIDASDYSGRSVSSVGDFNGDGFDDILIGAARADPNGNSASGETYLIFGTNSSFPLQFNLSSLNGTNGIQFNGIGSNDWSGTSVSSAGDFNGDGFDDILISAYYGDPNGINDAGETYLIFGSSTTLPPQFDLSSLNGTSGIQFTGIDPGDYSGRSVSSAGDVNGDGFGDILIGAYRASPNSNPLAGETYLVFGTNNPLTPQFNLIDLNGTNGVIFNGIDTNDQSGNSVSSAGDFNGDGFDDILIGAFWAGPNGNNQAGETYLLLGTNVRGKYRDLATNLLTPPPPGTYNPGLAFTQSYINCPTGTFNPGTSLEPVLSCIHCPLATYQNLTGQSSCTKCPAGMYGHLLGISSFNSSCTFCPENTYSFQPGETKCTQCPSPQTTCPSPGLTTPFPAPGYQLISGTGPTSQFLPCYPPQACPGGKFGVCSTGYQNPQALCTECQPNYQRINNQCIQCTDALPPLIAIWYILLIFSTIPIASYSAISPKFILIVSFLQSISLFSLLKVPTSSTAWKSSLDTLSTLTLFNLQSLQCHAPFISSTLLNLLTPLFGVLILVLGYSIVLLSHKLSPSSKHKFIPTPTNLNLSPTELKTSFTKSLILVLYMLYPITTNHALSTFSCKPLSPTITVLDSNSSIQCFSLQWWNVAWLSIILTVVYTIGFPVFIWWSSKLKQQPSILSLFPFYKPQYSYWESMILLRKAIILICIIAFPESFSVSLLFIVLLSGISLATDIKFQPFSSLNFDKLNTISLFTIFGLCLLAWTLFSVNPTIQSLLLWVFIILIFGSFLYFLVFKSEDGSKTLKPPDDPLTDDQEILSQ